METADTLRRGHPGVAVLTLVGVGRIAMRPLAIDDLPAMQRLLGRCDAADSETTVESIIRSLDWRPASASTLTLGAIADRGGRLVGLAGLAADGQIVGGARFGLLVDPECRRRGIGTALLAAVIGAAEDAGYRSLRGGASHGDAAIRALARQAGLALRSVDGTEPWLLERTLGPTKPAPASLPGRPGR